VRIHVPVKPQLPLIIRTISTIKVLTKVLEQVLLLEVAREQEQEEKVVLE